MDENVPEGDDLAVVTDSRSDSFVTLGKLCHGFADDLELAFHCCAQNCLGCVILEILSTDEIRQSFQRALDVM